MDIMISALRRFEEIATSKLQDSARIGVTRDGRLSNVDEAGYLSRAKTVTVRGQSQTDENNAVRTALLDALKTQFGANIPESVKAALKGSSLVGGSDMKTDSSGKVISGRPLTMRRIKAVMTAVKAELKRMNAVSEADVLRELNNIEISSKAYVNKNGSKDWIIHPSTEQYFTHIVNDAIKSATLSGASGESIVDVVAKTLVNTYSAQSSPNLRHYFPQLAPDNGKPIDREALKAAVRDFLKALGVDVNRPETAEHSSGVPELLFKKMPEVEVPAPEVNRPEVNRPEVNDRPAVKEPKFRVPTKESIMTAVDKRLAASSSRLKTETVVDRIASGVRAHLKGIINDGAATRDELAMKFSQWLRNTYNQTINITPVYIFPALEDPVVRGGINFQPLHDQVRAFLDEIGIAEK